MMTTGRAVTPLTQQRACLRIKIRHVLLRILATGFSELKPSVVRVLSVHTSLLMDINFWGSKLSRFEVLKV